MKKTSFAAAVLLLAAVGLIFWAVVAPSALARGGGPAELLQSNLPKSKTLGSASQSEVLDAVCSAIRKSPRDAAQVVTAAAGTRKELAADAVGKALTCVGSLNSELVAGIVAAGIAANPDAAAAITERAIMIAPDFRSAVERSSRADSSQTEASGHAAEGEGGFTNPPGNQNGPPGSFAGGGGGFNPQEGKCTVCHNDKNPHEISIPCSQVPKYLADHPGDYEGSCQATPVTNP
jgi:hypothetical protein